MGTVTKADYLAQIRAASEGSALYRVRESVESYLRFSAVQKHLVTTVAEGLVADYLLDASDGEESAEQACRAVIEGMETPKDLAPLGERIGTVAID